MIKTQVPIPDELFERAKWMAAAKEWSFAELVRRGLEQVTARLREDAARYEARIILGREHLSQQQAQVHELVLGETGQEFRTSQIAPNGASSSR